MQMVFMHEANEKGTIDAIFSVSQMMEKYEAAGKQFFIVFVDMEKSFDRVPREVVWLVLWQKVVA